MTSFPWNDNDNKQMSSNKGKTGQPVKNTCPWSTDGTSQVLQPRKTKPRSVCPWATDSEENPKENVMRQHRKPAPWEDVQSGPGFGGKKKKKQANDTTIWQATSAVDDRFSASAKFLDHSAAIQRITEENRQARASNGTGGSSLEGIF